MVTPHDPWALIALLWSMCGRGTHKNVTWSTHEKRPQVLHLTKSVRLSHKWEWFSSSLKLVKSEWNETYIYACTLQCLHLTSISPHLHWKSEMILELILSTSRTVTCMYTWRVYKWHAWVHYSMYMYLLLKTPNQLFQHVTCSHAWKFCSRLSGNTTATNNCADNKNRMAIFSTCQWCAVILVR